MLVIIKISFEKPAKNINKESDKSGSVSQRRPILSSGSIADDLFDCIITMSVPELLKEYDFVIVGAGPAGCVLANRLTESGRWSVLLLEAGQPESALNQLPMMVAGLEETDYAWKYPLERDEDTCLGEILNS